MDFGHLLNKGAHCIHHDDYVAVTLKSQGLKLRMCVSCSHCMFISGV